MLETPSPTSVLTLGKLLIERSQPFGKHASPSRIAEVAIQARTFLGTSNRAEGLLTKDKSGHPSLIQTYVLAVVVYQTFLCESVAFICFVSTVVGGSKSVRAVLEARRAAHVLIMNGALMYKDNKTTCQGWNGMLYPTRRVFALMELCGGRHPPIFTQATLATRISRGREQGNDGQYQGVK